MNDLIKIALKLLRDNCPPEGYWLAFSGGKDSIVCKKLLEMSGCKFTSHYSVTTIDPPELIRYIKDHHKDVIWDFPKHGNFFKRCATRIGSPPTRMSRWCCEEYKESGGKGWVCVFGVRKAESKARATRWKEISETSWGKKCICPIVDWSDADVWKFIRSEKLPYCSLYDEGWARLGCVGCPLGSKKNQSREFKRWPRYKKLWEWAVKESWKNFHNKPTKRDPSKCYYQSKFDSAEMFWQWWLTAKSPDVLRGECQQFQLWTNEPGITDEDLK